MQVLIDADGCPVVERAISCAKQFHVEVTLVCDDSHVFERQGAITLTVSKGSDSADFALVNLVKPSDLVVTQDYGLAAMALAKGAVVLSQDGMQYTDGNIDALLLSRHTARKIRQSGGRLKGPNKRTSAQNDAFTLRMTELLSGMIK